MADARQIELFGKKAAESYDARFEKIQAVNHCLHLLIRLVLDDLPEQASVLCVGVGTGADILGLAQARPRWRFTGIDPSEHMLAVCRQRLERQGLLPRCQLVHGHLADVPEEPRHDAVLCLLVSQFVTDRAQRRELFRGMGARLRPGGCLVNAEISGDMESPEFRSMAEKWKAMHRLTGASEEQAAGVIRALREHVAVEPPNVIEGYLRAAGLGLPVQFFQSLFIRAWYAGKPGA